MLNKRSITQLVWLIALIAFLGVALTGDRSLYDFGGGILAGSIVLFGGYLSVHLFWDDE